MRGAVGIDEDPTPRNVRLEVDELLADDGLVVTSADALEILDHGLRACQPYTQLKQCRARTCLINTSDAADELLYGGLGR